MYIYHLRQPTLHWASVMDTWTPPEGMGCPCCKRRTCIHLMLTHFQTYMLFLFSAMQRQGRNKCILATAGRCYTAELGIAVHVVAGHRTAGRAPGDGLILLGVRAHLGCLKHKAQPPESFGIPVQMSQL